MDNPDDPANNYEFGAETANLRRLKAIGLIRKAVIPKAKVVPVVEAIVPAPDGVPKGLIEATMALGTMQCHWPHGDPQSSEFHYCGAPAGKPFGFCPEHERRARKPKSPRETLT